MGSGRAQGPPIGGVYSTKSNSTKVEELLKRDGHMDEFNRLVMELLNSRYIKELTKEEEKAWGRILHYICLQHVINRDSATRRSGL